MDILGKRLALRGLCPPELSIFSKPGNSPSGYPLFTRKKRGRQKVLKHKEIYCALLSLQQSGVSHLCKAIFGLP